MHKKMPNLQGHLHEITYLYKIADGAHRLPKGNPAAKLKVPRKPPHTPRKPFTDEEAWKIWESARHSDDPIIRWFHPIAAMTGANSDEILKMKKSEFRQVRVTDPETGEILESWVWDFSERPVTQAKTPNRPRAIPLHDSIIQLGFIEWMQQQPNGRVFDFDPTRNISNRLMKHIRSLGIKNTTDEDGNVTAEKVFYSWRHGFISEIEDLTTADRARFLAGHAGKDIHAKNYLHHAMPKLIKAIRGLKNPTQVHPDDTAHSEIGRCSSMQ